MKLQGSLLQRLSQLSTPVRSQHPKIMENYGQRWGLLTHSGPCLCVHAGVMGGHQNAQSLRASWGQLAALSGCSDLMLWSTWSGNSYQWVAVFCALGYRGSAEGGGH